MSALLPKADKLADVSKGPLCADSCTAANIAVIRVISDVHRSRATEQIIYFKGRSVRMTKSAKGSMDVFISSARPWDHMDPNIQKHTQGPPL